MDKGQRLKLAVVICLAVVAAAAALFAPRIPQSAAYHNFSDQRTILGVPNFCDVVSNLPFAVIGAAGAVMILRGRGKGALPELRSAYLVFFAAVTLVAFGSGYYHLNRTNATLVWDRLPLSVAFMAFFSAVVGEHVSARLGRRLLWPLVVLGAASVVYWHATELRGCGDLRPNYLMQALALTLTPAILILFRSSITKVWYLWGMLGCYVLAKVAELYDAPVFHLTGGALSGHTLKHLLAALGCGLLLLALRNRSPQSNSPDGP